MFLSSEVYVDPVKFLATKLPAYKAGFLAQDQQSGLKASFSPSNYLSPPLRDQDYLIE
jgi:hypothetical protein